MFKRLYVDNYKSLVNFDLRFDELTLILGVNGVGKTAVLDVVFALRQLLSGVAEVTDRGVFPASTVTRWRGRPTQTFETEAELGGIAFCYRLEVEHDFETRKSKISSESLTGDGDPLVLFEGGNVQLYRDDGSMGPAYGAGRSESALARVSLGNDNRKLASFMGFMRNAVVCSIYPASFSADAANADDPMLSRDARNFSAWYRSMQLKRPDCAAALRSELRNVVDGFDGMRIEKAGLDTRALMVSFGSGESVYELRLDEVPDGQRALIALYALLRLSRSRDRPAEPGSALFLDEPDNYVALAEIQPWLLELADSCGETIPQAVLCSHHPELIDYLGDDRGRLLVRERSGATRTETLEGIRIEGGLKLSEVIARGWER